MQSSWGIDGINRIPACDTAVLSVNDAEKKQNELVIYPNPASNEINIRFSSPDKKLILNIIDAKGSIISVKEVSSSNSQYHQKINTEFLSAGVYFVQIKGDKTSFSKSFIKKEVKTDF